MPPIINQVLICFFVLIVWRQYRKEPAEGLCLAFFLLVSMPTSLSVIVSEDLPTITIHRAILGVLLVCALWGSSKSRALMQVSFGKILTGIAASCSISTMLSPFLSVSVKQYLYFIIEVLGTFWIVRRSIQSASEARRLINWIGAGLAFVGAVAAMERYTGWRVSDLFPRGVDEQFFWAVNNGEAAVTSTYSHRILLGLACSLGALKYLQDLILDDAHTNQRVAFLGTGLCLAALYFSMSRGPWLAFAACAGALIVATGGKGIKWGGLFTVLVCVVLLIMPGVFETIAGLASSTLDPNTVRGSSFQWRFVVINTALSAMSEAGFMNVLFGFGGGSQLMMSFGKYEVAPGVWLPIESWDCEYAVLLYDKGWVGLLLVVLLSGVALVKVVGVLRRDLDKETHAVALSVLLVLLFFTVARTNVAVYAPQLVYIEMASFALASMLLDKTRVRNRTGLAFGRRAKPIYGG